MQFSRSLLGLLLRYAGTLRFGHLFLLTFGLFVVDLIVPDGIPFADEMFLGLLSLLLASWKKPQVEEEPPASANKPSGKEGRVIEGEWVSKPTPKD